MRAHCLQFSGFGLLDGRVWDANKDAGVRDAIVISSTRLID